MTAVADLEPSVTHHDGIAALLTAQLAVMGAECAVYRGKVPADPQFPYLVVWGAPSSPLPDADRLAGWGGDVVSTTQITAAGLDEDQVLAACDRAVRALYRRRPVIAGRRCGDVGVVGVPGRPTQSPEKWRGQPVFFTPLLFDLCSSPATQ